MRCAALLAIGACATAPAKHEEIDPARSYWFHYDATRRGAVVMPNSAQVRICAEPSPDAALQIVEKLKAEVEAEGVTGSVEGAREQDIVKLAERTQTIMILREALYRLCELSLNSRLTKDEAKDLYAKVFDGVVQIAKAEADAAAADRAEAEAKLLDAKRAAGAAIDAFDNRPERRP